MLICPDCHGQLQALGDCSSCGWRNELIAGVPNLLSTTDRSSPTFNAYLANYARIAEDDLRSSIQPPEHLEAQARSLFSYLGPVKGLRVCEVGVGQGMLFERLLAAEADTVTGIDISMAYLRRYASTGRVLLANAENLPYRKEFDLLVVSEILEHVLNLGDALISIHRSLVVGGRAVVRVPYKEDLRQYARQWNCQYQFVHLRTFTRDSLLSVMRQAGFELRSLVYDGCYDFRMRPWARRLTPFLLPYLAHIYAGELPARAIHSLMARLLFEPVTLTAIFEKKHRRNRPSGKSKTRARSSSGP
jgi:SAM-dependent methyltransferase